MPQELEQDKKEYRLSFMDDDEIRMVDDFLAKIEANRGELDEYYDRWEKEQEAYAMDQPIEENRPNSRVNIVNANIEGQVAELVDQNLAVISRGEGPSDQGFARWARIGLEWTLRKNRIKKLMERHERRRLLFGPAWFKVYFDPDEFNGFGLVKITCPPLNSMFVDTKIYDPMNLQDAEYIAEVMMRSKPWAKEKYGKVADHINYGGSDRSSVFAKDTTMDDENAFWLVQLWTKTDGKLRLIEFSDDGVLLFDSFKEWDEKEQKWRDLENPKPFYRYNRYPYFLTNLYYEEGKLLGFGDGKLLRPLQDLINDLYDQIRRAARPYRIFFDPDSEVDLTDYEADDGPVPCKQPNENIRVVQVNANSDWWNLLANIHIEVQRVIRYSELMMGQVTRRKTATEAAIQQQQGSSGIDFKKLMLQETLVEVCEYALDLMMENYTEGRAFRIDEQSEDYEWIEFQQLNAIPRLVPADSAFTKRFEKKNPGMPAPRWMQLKDKKGKPMTKSVEFDLEINIGAGLPKNKAFLWQMLERLSRIVVDGKTVLNRQEFRSFIEDFLAIPLEPDELDLLLAQAQQAPPVLPQQQLSSEVLPSAVGQGLSAINRPMTQQNLPSTPFGGMIP